MTSNKRQAEWESFASTWIKKCDEGDPNRDGMLDRWMLEVLGPVKGMRIVDFDESARIMRFSGHPLTNFHRTLTTYINGFLEAG